MKHYISLVNIPAYDAQENGLLVALKISTTPHQAFTITAVGAVATALQKNFTRTIEIMASVSPHWADLLSNSYRLESSHNNLIVKDAKSSSMAMSIALINIHRALHGKMPKHGFTGTGVLRIDGSFEGAHLEEKKYLAAKSHNHDITEFITPQYCGHLHDLDNLINLTH